MYHLTWEGSEGGYYDYGMFNTIEECREIAWAEGYKEAICEFDANMNIYSVDGTWIEGWCD